MCGRRSKHTPKSLSKSDTLLNTLYVPSIKKQKSGEN